MLIEIELNKYLSVSSSESKSEMKKEELPTSFIDFRFRVNNFTTTICKFLNDLLDGVERGLTSPLLES